MGCNREDLLQKLDSLHTTSYRLCGSHFKNVMFLNNLRNRLHSDAVPTIFPALEDSSSSTVELPLNVENSNKDISILKVEEDIAPQIGDNSSDFNNFTAALASPRMEGDQKTSFKKEVRHLSGISLPI